MDAKEKMLFDILRDTNCAELPEPIGEGYKKIWIYAIGDTVKSDGSRSYAILKAINNEDYKILKDYGSNSAIKRIDAIRPYMTLYARYIPEVKTKEDVLRFIASERWELYNTYEGAENYIELRNAYIEKAMAKIGSMSNSEIKKEFYKYAIIEQVNGIAAKKQDLEKYYEPQKESEAQSIDGVFSSPEVAEKVEKLKEYQAKVNGTNEESTETNSEVKEQEPSHKEPTAPTRRKRQVGRKN